MKATTLFFILLSSMSAMGQDLLPQPPDTTATANEDVGFYIVQAGKLFYEIDSEEKNNEMEALSPAWIESITVYRGADARLKYGEMAAEGVVIIALTQEGFTQLPKALRSKFKKKGQG